MRTALIRLCCVISLVPFPAAAIVVDQAVITVGNRAITESEVIERIRLSAFQNGQPPDFSVASRREAARQLIDQKLVEHEMDLGHYLRTPPDQAKELMAAFAAEHFRGDTEAIRVALAAISLTPTDLLAELSKQADLLSFLSLRFRPAVQISEADIEKYFREHIESKVAANPVALNEVRSGIEQILANRQADADLETWLQEQRSRTRIVYLQKELQ